MELPKVESTNLGLESPEKSMLYILDLLHHHPQGSGSVMALIGEAGFLAPRTQLLFKQGWGGGHEV